MSAGLHAAGWLSYEAGLSLERRLVERAQRPDPDRTPLLWFGLFDNVTQLEPDSVSDALPDASGAWLSTPRPRISRAQYSAAFARAAGYIKAGDIYQVNLSYRADVDVVGHPLAAYARLRAAGQGGWSALVYDGANWLLSTSPELFFRLRDGAIEARPMKGTAKRRADPNEDRQAAEALKRDPKELAENVMIVDLLRNDLSRLAKPGTVRVPELFTVETYPTLHTLTSTVRAEIGETHDAIDVLRALFPCGSITGAPKIRAMEIVAELENDRRGPYTGSIGWIAPDGSAEFNVAIRTLALRDGAAEVGLGSAVVLDSSMEGEWEECQTKAAFITAGAPTFSLIETMRFEPGAGVVRRDLHLQRLQRSAAVFGFPFDRAVVLTAIDAMTMRASESCIARLTLNAAGKPHVELKPLPQVRDALSVSLAPLPVAPDDFRLRHKTTLRDFYEDARSQTRSDEVVFIDPDGFITEGSFTNVFVERDGVLLTPPASRGLLPGVLRAELLANGRACEADLRLHDLEDGFLLGNSLRGLIQARFAEASLRDAG